MSTKAELKAKMSLDNRAFVRGMQSSIIIANRLGGQMQALGTAGIKAGMVGMTAAILVGSAAMAGSFKNALALGGQFTDMSARTGEQVSALVVANQAYKAANLSSEQLESSIARLQKTIAGGSDVFGTLGINLDRIRKQSPVQQLETVATAIAAIQDPAQRTAAAMSIFGKSGAQLLSVFRDPAAFQNARDILGSMPGLLQQSASLFDDLGDAVEGTRVKWDQFSIGLASGMAPQIKASVDAINTVDFAPLGQRFGQSLAAGFEIAKLVMKDPGNMFLAYTFKFDSVARGFGNSLISAGMYAGDVIYKTVLGAFANIKPTAMEFIAGMMDILASGMMRSLSLSIGTIGNLLPGAIGEPLRKISGELSNKAEKFTKGFAGSIIPTSEKFLESFAKAADSTAFVKKDYLGATDQAEMAANFVEDARNSSRDMLKNFIASAQSVSRVTATAAVSGVTAVASPAVASTLPVPAMAAYRVPGMPAVAPGMPAPGSMAGAWNSSIRNSGSTLGPQGLKLGATMSAGMTKAFSSDVWRDKGKGKMKESDVWKDKSAPAKVAASKLGPNGNGAPKEDLIKVCQDILKALS